MWIKDQVAYYYTILWQIYVGLMDLLIIQCGLYIYYVDKRSGYLMGVLLDSVITVCRCHGIKRMKSNIIVFLFIYTTI